MKFFNFAFLLFPAAIALSGCTPPGSGTAPAVAGPSRVPVFTTPDITLPASERSRAARERVLPGLKMDARAMGLEVGGPVFIRSFKQEKTMEVWLKKKRGGRYRRFRTYDVCSYPGPAGPKLRRGDLMIPEGFYRIDGQALNPLSDYHLSMDLGYPNKLERSLGRTGSNLMVHGGCESIGCYAVGDANMEEIYTLVYEALKRGQAAVEFHAYPFALTDANLARHRDSKWHAYWTNLKEGFDAFEYNQHPPQVLYGDKAYRIVETGTGLVANR